VSIATIEPDARADSGRGVQVVLCLAAFLAALNFFAPTPFYPQMARDLQTTVPLLGQVVTLMALLSAALGLAIGPLVDRYGFRWPLVIGLLAIATGLLGTGLAPAYPVVLVLGLLGGLGDALVFAVPFAIAATHFRGDTQRRVIGWTIGSLSLAPIIGVPLLTALGGITSWRVALCVAGLVGASVAWLVAVILPADAPRAATSLSLRGIVTAYIPLLRHAPSLRLFAVSTLRGFWWVGLLTYLGAFLGTALGLGEEQVGIVYALSGIAYTCGSVAGSRIHAVPPRILVALCSAIGGVVIAPLFMFPIPSVVVPLLLVTSLAAAASSVSVVALLAAESPAGAGTTMVLNGSVLNVGTAGGAILGGFLLSLGGFAALGLGLPLFALLAAVVAWWPARL
jgi:DHA1 family inner membrane transport protein